MSNTFFEICIMRKDLTFDKWIFRICSDCKWFLVLQSVFSREKDDLSQFLKSQRLRWTAKTKFRMERSNRNYFCATETRNTDHSDFWYFIYSIV